MKTYSRETLDSLIHKAQNSPRKRSHLNIHDELNEDIQRLLIALEPESYVRPHFHPEPNKKELIILLQGSCACFTFHPNGKIKDKFVLDRDNPICEFPIQTWHSLMALESRTIITEVKAGPYTPLSPENFAEWAPSEGSPEASSYLDTLKDHLRDES